MEEETDTNKLTHVDDVTLHTHTFTHSKSKEHSPSVSSLTTKQMQIPQLTDTPVVKRDEVERRNPLPLIYQTKPISVPLSSPLLPSCPCLYSSPHWKHIWLSNGDTTHTQGHIIGEPSCRQTHLCLFIKSNPKCSFIDLRDDKRWPCHPVCYVIKTMLTGLIAHTH